MTLDFPFITSYNTITDLQGNNKDSSSRLHGCLSCFSLTASHSLFHHFWFNCLNKLAPWINLYSSKKWTPIIITCPHTFFKPWWPSKFHPAYAWIIAWLDVCMAAERGFSHLHSLFFLESLWAWHMVSEQDILCVRFPPSRKPR